MKYLCGPLHTAEQLLDDQLEHIYSSSGSIQDVAWKSFRERWTIETGVERESGKSVLATPHADGETECKQIKDGSVGFISAEE